MRKIVRSFWCAACIAWAVALALVPVSSAQQLDVEMVSSAPEARPQEVSMLPPPAPVPVQLLTATKAFVSNLGADTDLILPDHYSGGADRTYNQFYAAIKNWGRFQLVSRPADSDLILGISWTAPVGPTRVFQGDGGSGLGPQFTLTIVDPRTQIVLWKFTEHLDMRHATHDQSFDQAMARIVDDLKKLVTQSPATPASAAK